MDNDNSDDDDGDGAHEDKDGDNGDDEVTTMIFYQTLEFDNTAIQSSLHTGANIDARSMN